MLNVGAMAALKTCPTLTRTIVTTITGWRMLETAVFVAFSQLALANGDSNALRYSTVQRDSNYKAPCLVLASGFDSTQTTEGWGGQNVLTHEERDY